MGYGQGSSGEFMNIGKLSELTGVSRDALRMYERQGLIRAERRANGYRDFDRAMVRLVQMIRQGQSLGFSLREIAQITGAMQDGGLDVVESEAVLRDKIAEVDSRILRMQDLRGMLLETLEQVCPLRTP